MSFFYGAEHGETQPRLPRFKPRVGPQGTVEMRLDSGGTWVDVRAIQSQIERLVEANKKQREELTRLRKIETRAAFVVATAREPGETSVMETIDQLGRVLMSATGTPNGRVPE